MQRNDELPSERLLTNSRNRKRTSTEQPTSNEYVERHSCGSLRDDDGTTVSSGALNSWSSIPLQGPKKQGGAEGGCGLQKYLGPRANSLGSSCCQHQPISGLAIGPAIGQCSRMASAGDCPGTLGFGIVYRAGEWRPVLC